MSYSQKNSSKDSASIEAKCKIVLTLARVQRIRAAVIAGFVLLAIVLAYARP